MNDTIITLNLACPLNAQSVSEIINTLNNAAQNDNIKFKIMLSCIGGDMHSALLLYHYLRKLKNPLEIWNVGTVESSAVLVYLAADKRFAVDVAKFLVHPISIQVNESLRLPRLYELSESLKLDIESYAKIFENRTKNSKEKLDVRKYLTIEAVAFDKQQAIDLGVVNNR